VSKALILTIDTSKQMYVHNLDNPKVHKSKSSQKKMMTEVAFKGVSNFIIDLQASDKGEIWVLNSLRQLFVCRNFNYNELVFEPVNEAFNVFKISLGAMHQAVIKIEKELDELMVRDPYYLANNEC